MRDIRREKEKGKRRREEDIGDLIMTTNQKHKDV
jgi:hypothetical protein